MLGGGFVHLMELVKEDEATTRLARVELVQSILRADDIMAAAGEKTRLLVTEELLKAHRAKGEKSE